MKNTKISSILSSGLIACALILGSLASTHSASAQGSMVLAKVNIPFAFQSGNETLPAGLYTIDREGAHVILLRGPKGAAGFAMTHEANRRQPSKQGTIVFAHYGDKYFLRQLWTAGSTEGLECSKGRAEKAAVVAENKQAATPVELAFNLDPLK